MAVYIRQDLCEAIKNRDYFSAGRFLINMYEFQIYYEYFDLCISNKDFEMFTLLTLSKSCRRTDERNLASIICSTLPGDPFRVKAITFLAEERTPHKSSKSSDSIKNIIRQGDDKEIVEKLLIKTLKPTPENFVDAVNYDRIEILKLLIKAYTRGELDIWTRVFDSQDNKRMIETLIYYGMGWNSLIRSKYIEKLPVDLRIFIFNTVLFSLPLNDRKTWVFWITWAPFLGEKYIEVSKKMKKFIGTMY
jgi:hypothetical protein